MNGYLKFISTHRYRKDTMDKLIFSVEPIPKLVYAS